MDPYDAGTPAPAVVLVAEDEALVRMLATDVLEDAGYEVVETRNAAEALALLQKRTDVRAVFSDIEMPPGMNGLELAREVRKRWPGMAILIASGKMRPGPEELPPGARFIPKPYEPDMVVRALRAIVGA